MKDVSKLIKIYTEEYGVSLQEALLITQQYPEIIDKALESGEQSFYAAAMLLNWQYDNKRKTI